MAMEVLGIKFEASYEEASNRVKKMGQAFENFGNKTKGATDKVAGLAQKNKKLGQSFVNLNKDVNRSSQTFGSLAKVLKGVGFVGSLLLAAKATSKYIDSAMDMIETQNLFNVALGENAVQSGRVLESMTELTGLDLSNVKNAVGTYSLLARSMGFSSGQADKLSNNTYRLALDLSSLTNVPIAQVLQDLRSGLLGQSETVYKYGLDVTEAALKEEALAQGISKSVRNMNQGEKMALRYSVMLKQSSIVHGDFARTIEEPANQLRILKERFTTLSRAIGSIFIPVLSLILPYANAVVQVLTRVAQAIAKLLGFKPPKDTNFVGNIGNGEAEEGIGNVTGGLGKAIKKAKELQKITLGIDELNILPAQTDSANDGGGSGGGGIGGGGNILDDMELPGFDSLLDQIKTKSDEIAASMERALASMLKWAKPTIDAFDFLLYVLGSNVKPALIGILVDFYEDFMKPVATWTVSEAFPRMLDAISLAIQKVDWDNIRLSLAKVFDAFGKFTITSGEYLLWVFENVLVPLAGWTIGEAFPVAMDIISNAFRGINAVLETLKPLWESFYEDVLIPVGVWAGEVFIGAMETISDLFSELADFLEDNDTWILTVTESIIGIGLAWQGIKILSMIGQVGGLTSAMKLLWGWIIKNTAAKVADRLETIALTLMYAKDAVAKGISTVATIAGTVATGVATAATWLFNTALAVLTSPITLVVLAIAALIAIVILLVKNWDKVKEVASNVWEWIKGVWSKAGEWFSGVGTAITSELTKAWESLKTGAKNAWDGVKSVFSKVGTFFSDTFSKAWNGVKDIFSTGGKVFDGIKDGISNVFKNIVNGLIKGINKVVSVPFNAINGMLNTIRSINILGYAPFSSMWKYNPISVPQIPQLARGGILDGGGGLFQAGEFGKAEMIGSYGGKTTVMPLENTDFVDAMFNAVFSAVTSAMSQQSGGSGGSGGDIILKLNELELGRASISGIKKVRRVDGSVDI